MLRALSASHSPDTCNVFRGLSQIVGAGALCVVAIVARVSKSVADFGAVSILSLVETIQKKAESEQIESELRRLAEAEALCEPLDRTDDAANPG